MTVWFAVLLALACIAPDVFADWGDFGAAPAIRANAGQSVSTAGPERGKHNVGGLTFAVLGSAPGLLAGSAVCGLPDMGGAGAPRFGVVGCNCTRAPPSFPSYTL